VIETALGPELTEHLGHPPGGAAQGRNVRNGAGRDTLSTDPGSVEVRTPRDRDGSSSPSSRPRARPGRPAWNIIARVAHDLLRSSSVIGLLHLAVGGEEHIARLGRARERDGRVAERTQVAAAVEREAGVVRFAGAARPACVGDVDQRAEYGDADREETGPATDSLQRTAGVIRSTETWLLPASTANR
jgi:Transposase, Mutator family